MSSGQATVYIVDDEIQIRTAIGHLCEETGHQAKLFASTEEFLAESISEGPSCLVLDVRFPGLSPTGLELQSRLAEAGVTIPIVFISGHLDVRVSVEAMKRGAVEFLPKPFREQEILDAIRHGIERDRRRKVVAVLGGLFALMLALFAVAYLNFADSIAPGPPAPPPNVHPGVTGY